MSGNVSRGKISGAGVPVQIAATAERKATPRAKPKTDRRILKTRNDLGDALMTLMQEKPFDEITVQHVLDRAGVGRSTFYAHYTDKDDLFLSDVEDFFEKFTGVLARKQASLRRLAPVEEFFSHVGEARVFVASLVSADKFNDVVALGRGIFARAIEERLRLNGIVADPAQLSAQAYALAGSLFALLDWWIDHDMKAPPKQMDELFHSMAWSGMPVARFAQVTAKST